LIDLVFLKPHLALGCFDGGNELPEGLLHAPARCEALGLMRKRKWHKQKVSSFFKSYLGFLMALPSFASVVEP
jgi:hypothetical protein